MKNPRRSRLELCSSAEVAIFEAIQKVEEMGAHEKLTKAQELLSEAKELVSDFVDAGISISDN